MWLPCRRLPSTSSGHMISVLSSLQAAQPQIPCAHYEESLCLLVQQVHLPSPRRAGEKSALHYGLLLV